MSVETKQSWTLSQAVHKLWVGAKLRCPNCEQGKLFSSFLNMNRVCDHCGVRFERQDGESIGGMIFNFAIVVPLAFAGFFITEAAFHPPLIVQMVGWSLFCLVLIVLLYRSMRGLWVATSYLTGGVQRDEINEESQ